MIKLQNKQIYLQNLEIVFFFNYDVLNMHMQKVAALLNSLIMLPVSAWLYCLPMCISKEKHGI